MTKNALKLLLPIQAKNTCWFLGIYALVMAILFILFSFIINDDASWISSTMMFAPKIYLLVMGIIYPLTATRFFVAQGLTRKQFFWACTGSISIVSLFLLIPVLASSIFHDSILLPSAMTHYLEMPLLFLIGWTAVVGFQFGKGYTAVPGILGAIAMFQTINTVPEMLALSDLATLGIVILLLVVLLLILPRIISQVPIKA